MNCCHCKKKLDHIFLDLGKAPISNAYLKKKDLIKNEKYYPLKVYVCDKCWLVQIRNYTKAEKLFNSKYAYFSSTSSGWLNHAKEYSKMIINRLKLNKKSLVIEIASNDGYLLKNFLKAGIPCLGIEPTDSTANVALKKGIQVLKKFFNKSLAKKLCNERKKADLIIGNNVYAHVPDINNFTKGLKTILKKDGTITLEFPHIMRLIEFAQFDTIYHEHFFYLSLHTVIKIFKHANLRIYDIEEIPTHGGSLRIYGCHMDDNKKTSKSVNLLLKKEKKKGLQKIKAYQNFQTRVDKIIKKLINFLKEKKNQGKTVLAYGAAAKGNTLLNYAGINKNLLPLIFDLSKSKQGWFMPGSHIPIKSPKFLKAIKPDYILILPWNLAKEIRKQNELLEKKGTKFVIAIPTLKVLK